MEQFGLNLWQLLWQAVAFGLLVFLLVNFLFRPFLKTLDKRSAKLQEGFDNAEELKQQLARTEGEFDRRMAEAEKRSQAVLAQATEIGEKAREEILAEAREEAARLIEGAREEIASEREQAMADVREQVADLSVLIAQQLIGKTLDEKTHRRLIQEFIAEVGDLG